MRQTHSFARSQGSVSDPFAVRPGICRAVRFRHRVCRAHLRCEGTPLGGFAQRAPKTQECGDSGTVDSVLRLSYTSDEGGKSLEDKAPCISPRRPDRQGKSISIRSSLRSLRLCERIGLGCGGAEPSRAAWYAYFAVAQDILRTRFIPHNLRKSATPPRCPCFGKSVDREEVFIRRLRRWTPISRWRGGRTSRSRQQQNNSTSQDAPPLEPQPKVNI